MTKRDARETVERMRAAVVTLTKILGPEEFALIPTSRDLEAVVDKRFERQAGAERWYAVISRDDHMHAAADIGGRRVSLQRYIMQLHLPDRSLDELKNVSFANKVTFDCRVSNIEGHIGRQAAMRNRRGKSNTSSVYKGVRKDISPQGSVRWRTQITSSEGTMSIGVYDDELWAAAVYDAAAYLLFDGQALYNFPDRRPDFDALDLASIHIVRFRAKVQKNVGRG